MKIFDFTVNTQDATIDDFNNAVDYLRYMDARSNWNTDSYSVSDRPNFFNEQPLTYEEYENWIKAIYVFIERCIDFYPPSSNFSFPYRKFNMQNGIEHYLFIYIMMEYMKNQEHSLFEYDDIDNEKTNMEKELSAFVNTSQFIRAFVIAYKPVVDFDMNQYKDFGKSFKMDDFLLDCFPFSKAFFEYKTGSNEWDRDEIRFSFVRYVVCDGKLYSVKPGTCYLNEEKIKNYFELFPEYKEKFDALIKEIIDNKSKADELSKKSSGLWDERTYALQDIKKLDNLIAPIEQKLLYNNSIFYTYKKRQKDFEIKNQYISEKEKLESKVDKYSSEIDSIKKEIQELSGKNKIRNFILSLPDFIPYKEV